MKIIIKERKMVLGTKVTIDAVLSSKEVCEKEKDELFKNLAQIFYDAYRENCLVTTDYFTLCDIVIKQMPVISYRKHCNLQMTADRVVIELSEQKEKYIERIEKCFRDFYERT